MTTYTPEIGDKVCALLTQGCSLRTIAKHEGMPSPALVCKWLAEKENDAFREQYARAREAQADYLFDEMLDIADSQEGDVIIKEDGTELVNHDAIARAKLRVDTRKWMAGKLRPKVYGDKIVQEQTGPEGGPVQHVHKIERQIVRANTSNPNG